MTTTSNTPPKPKSPAGGLGFLLFAALLASSCVRHGLSYRQLIGLVASKECPQARLAQSQMLVAFLSANTTRYVRYPEGARADLDSATLFQLGSLTTAYLVPKLMFDLERAGLTLDSVALSGGELLGRPWPITYGDLLLHHTGLPTYESPVGDDVVAQVEDKLTRIGRTPAPTERPFHFDHWNYTLARMALSKRLPDTRGDLRSEGLEYVDRANTSIRLRLAPTESTHTSTSAPKQATELFVASTGAMASADQLVALVRSMREPRLSSLAAKPTTQLGTDITLGWYKRELKNGHSVYTNAGRTRRHGAAVAFFPHTQTGVVVMAADSKPVDCLALDLLRNLNDNWKREPAAAPAVTEQVRP